MSSQVTGIAPCDNEFGNVCHPRLQGLLHVEMSEFGMIPPDTDF